MFKHHPDGLIYVGEAAIPLEIWLIYEPGYALPEGYTGRVYEPGVRHDLITPERADPQPLAWAAGDEYLSKAAHYRQLERQRLADDGALDLSRKVEALWQ